MERLASSHVLGTFRANDVFGNLQSGCAVDAAHVQRIWPAAIPAIVCWEEDLLDELIQPIQADITEDWAHPHHLAAFRSGLR
jgi:hypothetical protein